MSLLLTLKAFLPTGMPIPFHWTCLLLEPKGSCYMSNTLNSTNTAVLELRNPMHNPCHSRTSCWNTRIPSSWREQARTLPLRSSKNPSTRPARPLLPSSKNPASIASCWRILIVTQILHYCSSVALHCPHLGQWKSPGRGGHTIPTLEVLHLFIRSLRSPHRNHA
ncbi:hypothetical protein BKA82DRAFT_4266563 [Pisolithus tinctorius]|nr:hypothetical protein BKA82DRAFT_4266563 [Pisolithus tinctorius]